MAIEFTENQKAAINTPSGALVSAAAGSGKTAVLVERVINKICSENPVSADRLLVVTFTNAAAQEMRVRIEERLNEEYRKNPKNKFLLEQKIKIRNAKICTIDSYCIELVRENFDRLNINPDFSIGDESVLLPLSEAALGEVLNGAFEEETEDFNALLDAATDDYDETQLKNLIKDLYRYAQNMPFPEEWLKSIRTKSGSFENLCEEAYSRLIGFIDSKINILNQTIEALRALPKVYEKYSPVLKIAAADLLVIKEYAEKKDWDRVKSLINLFKFERLATPQGTADLALVVSAKSVCEGIKEDIRQFCTIFSKDISAVLADYQKVRRCADKLIELTLNYSEIFMNLRKGKNTLTFYDTEHFALSLLCYTENGEVFVRQQAKEIISRYDEVLVDEFQDTNNMQDMLFTVLSDNEKKLFVVGDIKQSIYRFRGANPKNFNDKKNRYIDYLSAQSGQLRKITLGSNFRSRRGICDAVNFIFDIVMNSDTTTIKYNQDEVLKPEAQYPENDRPSVELHFVDVMEKNQQIEGEAKNIARFIKDFMENGYLTDKNTKTLRKPEYKDFTILMRETRNNAPKYAQELEKYSIPVSYNLDGYIEKAEIQIMLSLLTVLENPTRDIEFLSLMMSPLFCFSADEIAKIRAKRKSGSLISAVADAASYNKKTAKFLDKIKNWRGLAISFNISDLINELFIQTNILSIVSVLPDGERRKRNLLQLHSIAIGYDNNGFSKNITAFISFLEKLAENNIRAAGNTAGDNCVSIRTIHYSKGLQYPVCILANTTKNFRTPNNKEKMLLDDDLGFSFIFNDVEENCSKSDILREIISLKETRSQIEEELRLLYVALTRAEEKLVIMLTDKNVENYIKNLAVPICSSNSLEEYRLNIKEANNYAELVCNALAVHPSMHELRTENDINGFFVDAVSPIKIEHIEADSIVIDINESEGKTQGIIDNCVAKKLKENFNYKYPYEQLKRVESKASVAIIAHKAEEKDYSFTSRPAFLSRSGMTPTQRGTATHRFMQYCDFYLAKENLLAEIERIYENEYLSIAEKNAIDIEAVKKFFDSPLYARIVNSDRVEREMRFLTEIPATELNGELPDALKDEMVVVQGQVDCVFIEKGEVVVIDFKTDRVKNPKDLIDTYAEQLEIYAKACAKIFELPIKEKILYSFTLSKEVKI